MDTLKTCKKCGESKDKNEFYLLGNDAFKRRATCIACHTQYRQSNRASISKRRKKYYQNTKEEDQKRQKKWRDNNEEKIKAFYHTDEYRKINRESQKKRRLTGKRQEYEQQRSKKDPAYRLRKYLSSKIARALKKNGAKKYMSFLKYVPYTINELKEHLEKQFAPWMNWNNQGSYRCITWNDDDQLTWTWQLDHIIPQTDLPYTSMTNENFQKCWALKNLRPLNSKQNLIEGTRRIRHRK